MSTQLAVVLIFLVAQFFDTGDAVYAYQTCSSTKEPFKLAYYKCKSVCIQTCNETKQMAGTCMPLPSGCPNKTTTCGAKGCECIPSIKLPGNPYSMENITKAMTPVVKCGPDSIKVIINKCAANAHGYRLGDFYLNGITATPITDTNLPLLSVDPNNTCKGSVSFSAGSIDYEFVIKGNLTACNGTAKIDPGYKNITYSNALQAIVGNVTSVISRKRSLFVEFTCSYALNLNLTLGRPLVPTNRDVRIDSGTSEGKFVVSLNLWETTWKSTPYISPKAIVSNSYIYVTVDAGTADPGRFKLQITSAKATPTSSPSDKIFYPLLVNGCPNPAETLADGIVVDTNGQGLDAQFKFRVFQFVNLPIGQPQLVYIHVVAHLCDEAVEGNCTMVCKPGNRGRRELRYDSKNTIVASSQPILVLKRNEDETEDDVTETETKKTDMSLEGAVSWAKGSWLALLVIILIVVLIGFLLLSLCILIYKSTRHNQEDFKPLIQATT
uniref:uromodulin isoform X1 n=1 Tax=Ciona intestinalis TaxID=7719 RepID=UPI0000523BC4|nr:uromodulin isoform X1 [Ciona intestinalis]|eukprot:XP_002127626.1 uromodulin isoform X1 [Ciona intestinalis]